MMTTATKCVMVKLKGRGTRATSGNSTVPARARASPPRGGVTAQKTVRMDLTKTRHVSSSYH